MNVVKLSAGAFQLTESLRKSTFNFNRFLNVARWNFAINRSQYLKLALSLFLVMSLPLLLFILKSVWVSAVTHQTAWALASIPGIGMGTWMSACFLLAWPILAGYTFHNLLTKQSRIKELTLPASNGEKFLFHALVTIVGSLLTYVVGYFLLDILQYFYVGIVYGFSNAHWIPYTSIFFSTPEFTNNILSILGDNASLWFVLLGDVSSLAFLSTFVLGNAIKYRHNVLWTILFHWAWGFFCLICLGLSIPLLTNGTMDWLWRWLSGLGADGAIALVKWMVLLFFCAIIALCWWQSYRLYCRAQITTKRNK